MTNWWSSIIDWFNPKPPRPGVQTFTYDYTHRLQLDFASAGPGAKPLVLLIHGGGWSKEDRSNMKSYGPSLIRAGYHCASIDYRLAPDDRWPAQLHDAVQSYNFLLGRAQSLGIDKDRVSVVGKSAGGHIGAMMALTTQCRIKTVASTAGALDLRGEATRHQREILDAAFGPNPSPSYLAECSPVEHVRRGVCPFLLIHGMADPLVPHVASVNMQRMLEMCEVPNETHLLPGEKHTFSKAAMLKERELIVAWFSKHL